MPNKTATVLTRITYTDENDAVQTVSSTVSVEYQSSLRGELDVPDAVASSTAFNIPFGTIAKATAVWVKNKSGQELSLKINGGAALQNIPDDGEVLFCHADVGLAADLTAVSLTTTALGVTAGSIAYKVFGDPT